MLEVRQALLDSLLSRFKGQKVKANFDLAICLPNTLSVCLEVQGWEVLRELEGTVEASTASACHSGSCATPSKVLVLSGLSSTEALRTLRLSVGVNTTKEEVDRASQAIFEACRKLKK